MEVSATNSANGVLLYEGIWFETTSISAQNSHFNDLQVNCQGRLFTDIKECGIAS